MIHRILSGKTEDSRNPLAQPKSKAKGNERWKCEDSLSKSADSCSGRAPRTATESFFWKIKPKVVYRSHLQCEIWVSRIRKRCDVDDLQWRRHFSRGGVPEIFVKSSTTLSNGVVFQEKQAESAVQVALAMRNHSFVYTKTAWCASFTMASSKIRRRQVKGIKEPN